MKRDRGIIDCGLKNQRFQVSGKKNKRQAQDRWGMEEIADCRLMIADLRCGM